MSAINTNLDQSLYWWEISLFCGQFHNIQSDEDSSIMQI